MYVEGNSYDISWNRFRIKKKNECCRPENNNFLESTISYLFQIPNHYSFVQILIKAQGQTLFAWLDDTFKS